jgi:hypothetical protein
MKVAKYSDTTGWFEVTKVVGDKGVKGHESSHSQTRASIPGILKVQSACSTTRALVNGRISRTDHDLYKTTHGDHLIQKMSQQFIDQPSPFHCIKHYTNDYSAGGHIRGLPMHLNHPTHPNPLATTSRWKSQNVRLALERMYTSTIAACESAVLLKCQKRPIWV